MRLFFYILLVALSVLAACSDDNPVAVQDSVGMLTVDDSEVILPMHASYCTLKIEASKGSPEGLSVTVDADWLELLTDTVNYDGIVEVYACENGGIVGRSALLSIGNSDDNAFTEVKIYQCGSSDDDTNGSNDCYAGCGYNIFREINQKSSICQAIVDLNKVQRIGDKMIIQTVARHRQDVETLTSNSLIEMSDLMTKKQEKTATGLKGAKKTVSRFKQNSSYEADQTGYAYINLQRIVASSSLDFSKVTYYANKGVDIFTDGFSSAYDDIVKAPTEAKIFKLFKNYGTHIITFVDLGGSMDIAVNFSRKMVGQLNLRAEDFKNYFFESKPSDYTLNGTIQGVTSKVTNDGTFKIIGGSQEARNSIIADCVSGGEIKPEHIKEWEESLPSANFTSDESLRFLAPLNVQLMPIWSLFPQNLANMFFQCAMTESQNSGNAVSDSKAGMDNYAFEIKNADFMKFADTPETTLVRVVYASNQANAKPEPVLEICNEYVPTVNASRRITVIYPIRNGKPYHGTGLYPGEGMKSPPAWITFSEGDIYVLPIGGRRESNKIDSVFYLHGNIYLESLGLTLSKTPKMHWEDKHCVIYSMKRRPNYWDYFLSRVEIPFVKIGSGYWTKANIFSSIGSPEKEVADDYLLSINSSIGMESGAWGTSKNTHIGSKLDPYYDESSQWYFPTEKDRANLMKYIGQHAKELFPKQLTGFEAQFDGYYGLYEFPTHSFHPDGHWFENESWHYRGERCFLIFKKEHNSTTGKAMALDKNYQWQLYPLDTPDAYYFPLRLFRTSYFDYRKDVS